MVQFELFKVWTEQKINNRITLEIQIIFFNMKIKFSYWKGNFKKSLKNFQEKNTAFIESRRNFCIQFQFYLRWHHKGNSDIKVKSNSFSRMCWCLWKFYIIFFTLLDKKWGISGLLKKLTWIHQIVLNHKCWEFLNSKEQLEISNMKSIDCDKEMNLN